MKTIIVLMMIAIFILTTALAIIVKGLISINANIIAIAEQIHYLIKNK